MVDDVVQAARGFLSAWGHYRMDLGMVRCDHDHYIKELDRCAAALADALGRTRWLDSDQTSAYDIQEGNGDYLLALQAAQERAKARTLDGEASPEYNLLRTSSEKK